MTPDDPDEHPLAGIDRLLAGVLYLINLAEAQDRAPFEQSWWSLRGMKRGVVAALASIVNHKRRLSPTGAALLRTYLDEERAAMYRHAVQLGLVPRVGDTTRPRSRWSEPARSFYRGGATAPAPSPEDPSQSAAVGTALATLMGC